MSLSILRSLVTFILGIDERVERFNKNRIMIEVWRVRSLIFFGMSYTSFLNIFLFHLQVN